MARFLFAFGDLNEVFTIFLVVMSCIGTVAYFWYHRKVKRSWAKFVNGDGAQMPGPKPFVFTGSMSYLSNGITSIEALYHEFGDAFLVWLGSKPSVICCSPAVSLPMDHDHVVFEEEISNLAGLFGGSCSYDPKKQGAGAVSWNFGGVALKDFVYAPGFLTVLREQRVDMQSIFARRLQESITADAPMAVYGECVLMSLEALFLLGFSRPIEFPLVSTVASFQADSYAKRRTAMIAEAMQDPNPQLPGHHHDDQPPAPPALPFNLARLTTGALQLVEEALWQMSAPGVSRLFFQGAGVEETEKLKAMARKAVSQRWEAEQRGSMTQDWADVCLQSLADSNNSQSQSKTDNVAAEVLSLIYGTYDSVSCCLFWCMTQAAAHPQWLQMVKALSDKEEREAHLQAFVMEVFRLYPPNPIAKGFVQVATQIGGYAVPAQTGISSVGWISNRSKEVWGEDALEFNPLRFLHEGKHSFKKVVAVQGSWRIALATQTAALLGHWFLDVLVEHYGVVPLNKDGEATSTILPVPDPVVAGSIRPADEVLLGICTLPGVKCN
jgi:hypothetical protein